MSQSVPDDLLTAPVSSLFFDRNLLWHYRAEVDSIHDGDTFTALVDTGFDGRHIVRVRVADLYAPELTDPLGELARDKLWDALASPAVWPVRLVSRQRERAPGEIRSFERWVCDVFVVQADGGLVDVKNLL